ncbi:MAG: LysE family translocator [Wenzhouxiangellaceae bacterium]
MLSLETLSLFFVTAALLGLSPGPDNLFVLTQSALYGRRAGWLITLGLCTGLLVHTAAVAFGVAALFQTSVLAFTLLKLVGAAYLLWLAWQAFRAKPEAVNLQQENGGSDHRRLYRRGIIMNITNPKVSVFFLAFLPQFTDPSMGPISVQMLVLGAVFILSTIIVFGTIAMAAGGLGTRLKRSPGIQLWMNRIAGLVFVGLALKLATAQRS